MTLKINNNKAVLFSLLIATAAAQAEDKQPVKSDNAAQEKKEDLGLNTINQTIIARMNYHSNKPQRFSRRMQLEPSTSYIAKETESNSTTGDRTFAINFVTSSIPFMVIDPNSTSTPKKTDKTQPVATVRYNTRTKTLLAKNTQNNQWVKIENHPYLKHFPPIPTK